MADTETAASPADNPEYFVRVPIAECTLAEAKGIVEDASFYDRTRMAVLHHFSVPVDSYWDLTVRDHTEMVVYLNDRGLL